MMEENQREKLLRAISICQKIFQGTNLIHPDAGEIRRAREAMGDSAFDAILYWLSFLFEHAELR